MKKNILLFSLFVLFSQLPAAAQTMVDPEALENSILRDMNGDGLILIDAFGDSITRGVGDFTAVGADVDEPSRPTGEAGYPLRIESLLGIQISNLGIPGERETNEGLKRFAATFPGRRTDVVIISGGTNDAIDLARTSAFYRAVQTMLNIAHAEGAQPILVAPPPTCCDASSLEDIVNSFRETLRTLASVNNIPYANVAKGFTNTCGTSPESCFLLNSPEGIHPNTSGYDVMSEVILATLFSIDIFSPEGPLLLEQALGLPEGSVLTVPAPIPSSDS